MQKLSITLIVNNIMDDIKLHVMITVHTMTYYIFTGCWCDARLLTGVKIKLYEH